MEKFTLRDIIFWLVVLFLIVLFAWRVLGSSPTLEMLTMGLTAFFLALALESRKDSKYIRKGINLLVSANRKQVDILESINKNIRRK